MTPDKLLKAFGIPCHEEPEVGDFFQGLGGRWRHACSADFPFQSDVDLIFDMTMKSDQMPATMPSNVLWLQQHLTEIWNAAAAAVNELATTRQIQLDDNFQLDSIQFQLPDAQVQTAAWRMSIEPSFLHGSFHFTFQGLSVIGKSYKGI